VTVALFPPVPNPHPPTPDFNNLQNIDPSAYTLRPEVSQVISPEGGLITLTTPSGVAVQLLVPAGAVDEPRRLTLAPVQQVDGLPLSSGLIAAVQVRPQLPFEVPVTLTLAQAAGGASPAGAVAWAAETTLEGVPGEFWLYPSATQAGVTTLSLNRGGTYGLSAGTPAEAAQQARRLPTDEGAQLEQVLAAMRLAPEADQAPLIRLLLEGLRQKVEAIHVPAGRHTPGGALASPSRQAASPAAAALQTAIEQAQTVWQDTDFSNAASAAAAAALARSLAEKIKQFFDKVKGECLTADDFLVGYIGSRLRGVTGSAMWAQVAQAYQAAYGAAGEQLLQDLAEGNKACKFVLEVVDSRLVNSASAELRHTYKVHTARPMTLKLSYLDGAIFLWGGGNLTYDFYEFALKGCPPVQIKPYPTGGLSIVKLEPRWVEGQLNNFVLSQVESPAPGGTFNGTIFRDDSAGTCQVKVSQSGPPPDLWSPGFAGLWQQHRASHQDWLQGGSDRQQTWTLDVLGMGDAALSLDVTFKLTITRLAK
jgi:hypothetical protein